MATTSKKRGSLVSPMGRPKAGALSTYPCLVRDKIKSIREKYPSWGPINILLELEEMGYTKSALPSIDSIRRYLKQEGFIKPREPVYPLATSPSKKPSRVHQLWEMDAKGTIKVEGIGYQSLIDIKDGLSKKYCMTFPVAVKNANTQPSTRHYKWALRLAFLESGLPKALQVDKDSVFIENSSKSPFPSRIHLWLLGLGIQLHFIAHPPPKENPMVERSHRTMVGQVTKAAGYLHWGAYFKSCNQQRKRLNEKIPLSYFRQKSPFTGFSQSQALRTQLFY